MRSAVSVLVVLGGCPALSSGLPGNIVHGSADACLGGPDTASPPDTGLEPGGTATWEPQGTVVAERDADGSESFNLWPCQEPPVRVLEFADADGGTWILGWLVRDADAAVISAEAGLTAGDAVTVRFDGESLFESFWSGVVISDTRGPALALDRGVLPDDAVSGLAVKDGAVAATATDECGEVTSRALEFNGTSVSPDTAGSATVEGAAWSVRNIGNYAWEGDDQCADNFGYQAWAAWRQ